MTDLVDQCRRGNGMGWYLTLVDTICKEYGAVKPTEIKLRMPLAEAFGYYAVIASRRSGGEGTPTFEALELIDALEALEGAL